MALVNWVDDYSVNIKEMDEQHKKLIQLINGFYDTLRSDVDKETISTLLNEVIDYTKVHLSREEEIMREYDFPEYETHKIDHDDFTARVMDIKKQYEEGDNSAVSKIAILLCSWLMNHIAFQDKKYGVHCNNKGVY